MKIIGVILCGSAGLVAGLAHDWLAGIVLALTMAGCFCWDIGSTKTLWDD